MAFDPREHSEWVDGCRLSPSREEFTDLDLYGLRVRYNPDHLSSGHSPHDLVVIWTLLDMVERQKGWKP